MLRALREHGLGWYVREEPLEEWGELLDLFYRDLDQDLRPAPNALPFSVQVLTSFSPKLHGVEAPGRVLLFERSPRTCRDVFTKILLDDGRITPAEWRTFDKYYELLGWEPAACIYVDTPPEVCLERLQQRGRPAEQNVDICYLKRLGHAYKGRLASGGGGRVITLDGTLPAEELAAKALAAVKALTGGASSSAAS